MLDLEVPHLKMVMHILKKHLPDAQVLAFGSRVKGSSKRYSDLDLAVDAGHELSFQELALLETDLEESDLPIRVDVIDLRSISKEFKARVEREGIDLTAIDQP